MPFGVDGFVHECRQVPGSGGCAPTWTLTTIPASVPYIKHCRERLIFRERSLGERTTRLRVGLVRKAGVDFEPQGNSQALQADNGRRLGTASSR